MSFVNGHVGWIESLPGLRLMKELSVAFRRGNIRPGLGLIDIVIIASIVHAEGSRWLPNAKHMKLDVGRGDSSMR